MAENALKATVQYAGDEFFIGTSPSGHAQAIDTKGDRHAAPTPMEMLLVSVAACTAADVISILQKKRQDVTDYNVEISGTRADDHPRKPRQRHDRTAAILHRRGFAQHGGGAGIVSRPGRGRMDRSDPGDGRNHGR